MRNNEKKPASSLTQTRRPPGYQPGATFSGQTWRGQLKKVILTALLSTLPVIGTTCMHACIYRDIILKKLHT